MDRKQMCVANVAYKRSTPDEAKRTKNLLGYLTYRESRDEGAKMVAGQDRWVDLGMGKSVKNIAGRCDDLRSEHVLMFSVVINPSPDLVAMIPHNEREQFVRELTEGTMDRFFEARGNDTGCEMSYVLHHRETDDLESPGRHNPHTHVVLPGTIWNEDHAQRLPLYFSRNKSVNHIEMLHDANQQTIEGLLEQYIGLDWEERMDALEALREAQRDITRETPHGTYKEDEREIPFWGGTRQVDEEMTAIGYYRQDEDEISFRPIVQVRDRDYAAQVASASAQVLPEFPDDEPLELYAYVVKQLVAEGQREIETPQTTPTLDLDL